ncbi:MAG: hypothetical protein LBH20_04185 [Treponema sp.]|jgi:hypothetical protein|nr:hypothetical protein [Treponema sp.]
MTEKDVYQFYNDKVKILYSEIEARNNTLPVELLFEIHSAFDHLKRIHIDGESEDRCAEKAFSHLKRGLLDTFKLKLKYHNDDCTKLLQSKTDLRFVDNGKFLPSLLGKRKEIINHATEARTFESKNDIDAAFEKWYEVSGLIDEFEKEFFDPLKIQWAKKINFLFNSWTFIVGVVSGIIGSAIVQYLFPGLFRFLKKQ